MKLFSQCDNTRVKAAAIIGQYWMLLWTWLKFQCRETSIELTFYDISVWTRLCPVLG